MTYLLIITKIESLEDKICFLWTKIIREEIFTKNKMKTSTKSNDNKISAQFSVFSLIIICQNCYL